MDFFEVKILNWELDINTCKEMIVVFRCVFPMVSRRKEYFVPISRVLVIGHDLLSKRSSALSSYFEPILEEMVINLIAWIASVSEGFSTILVPRAVLQVWSIFRFLAARKWGERMPQTGGKAYGNACHAGSEFDHNCVGYKLSWKFPKETKKGGFYFEIKLSPVLFSCSIEYGTYEEKGRHFSENRKTCRYQRHALTSWS